MTDLPLLDFSLPIVQFPCTSGIPCAYPLWTASPYLLVGLHLFLGCFGLALFFRRRVALGFQLLAFFAYAFFLVEHAKPDTLALFGLFPLALTLFLQSPRSRCALLLFSLTVSGIGLGSGAFSFFLLAIFFSVAAALWDKKFLRGVLLALLFAHFISLIRFLPDAAFRQATLYFPGSSRAESAWLYSYFLQGGIPTVFWWGVFYLLCTEPQRLLSPLIGASLVLFLLAKRVVGLKLLLSLFPLQGESTGQVFYLFSILVLLYGTLGLQQAGTAPPGPRGKLIFSLLFFIPFFSLTRFFALQQDFYSFDDIFAQGVFFIKQGFFAYALLLLYFSFWTCALPRKIWTGAVISTFLFLAFFFQFLPKSRRGVGVIFTRQRVQLEGRGVYLPRSFAPLLFSESSTLFGRMGFHSVRAKEKLSLPGLHKDRLGFRHYTIPEALSLPFVAASLRREKKEEILASLQSPIFPAGEVLLSQDRSGKGARGRVRRVVRGKESVEITLFCPRKCFLHTGIPLFPGFSAEGAELFPVNIAFWGGLVQKGGRVTLHYAPPFLKPAALFSGAWLLGLLFWLVGRLFKKPSQLSFFRSSHAGRM